jgi:hypothetical protein
MVFQIALTDGLPAYTPIQFSFTIQNPATAQVPTREREFFMDDLLDRVQHID